MASRERKTIYMGYKARADTDLVHTFPAECFFSAITQEFYAALSDCETIVFFRHDRCIDEAFNAQEYQHISLLVLAYAVDASEFSRVRNNWGTAGIRVEAVPETEEIGALKALEKWSTLRRMNNTGYTETLSRATRDGPLRAPRVAIVGAGIIGLTTAWFLRSRGIAATVYERSLDPRTSGEDSKNFGATLGGGNARIFSFNESRNHLIRDIGGTSVLRDFFHHHIDTGGWSTLEKCTDVELKWLDDQAKIPKWLARTHEDDLVHVNRESDHLWRRMRYENPRAFERAGYREGIIRIYATEEQYHRGVRKERSIGSYITSVPLDKLVIEQPSLRGGIEQGNIGGAMLVAGFSLQIHDFCHALLDDLVDSAFSFKFGSTVASITHTNDGRLRVTSERDAQEFDYVFVSPGAYGNHLLSGRRTENIVHSVAGGWIKCINRGVPLTTAIKFTRHGILAESAAEGANIIPERPGCDGEQVIWVSSGHFYTGADCRRIDALEEGVFLSAARDTAAKLFPDIEICPPQAKSSTFCVRPWATACLGIFDIEATTTGALVVCTGHNTGGFSQAPAMAQAFVDLLDGCKNSVHWMYNPQRLEMAASPISDSVDHEAA